MPNKYGYEEIKPSLQVIDAGKINAFYSKLRIIHKPVVNKWVHSDEENFDLLINECAVRYAIKKMMYPTIVLPLVWLAFKRRCHKHLSHIPRWKKRTRTVAEDTMRLYPVKFKIKMKTILGLYRDFGASVF